MNLLITQPCVVVFMHGVIEYDVSFHSHFSLSNHAWTRPHVGDEQKEMIMELDLKSYYTVSSPLLVHWTC